MSGIFHDRAGDVPVTAVQPEARARGGIVVLHESREFGRGLLALLQALADEGWIAIAPHLFHRDDDAEEVFGDNLFADFDAAVAWLLARGVFPDTVGVLGFDDAGTAAFLVATGRSVAAAVSVGPAGLVQPLQEDTPALVDAAADLQAPWLGLFGADDATADIEALRDAVARAAVATNIVVYEGAEHRADTTVLSDDVDAQTRIFDWFDGNLR